MCAIAEYAITLSIDVLIRGELVVLAGQCEVVYIDCWRFRGWGVDWAKSIRVAAKHSCYVVGVLHPSRNFMGWRRQLPGTCLP